MSKLLTVFGATGAQGGSVVKTILSHDRLSKEFKLRAVTRDPSSGKAKDLASKGVEPVKGDLDDQSSVEAAIDGSYAVFAVTNYWDKASKAVEVAQGRAIADACKKTGVKHLVWSTLPNVSKLSNGKLTRVEHFDGKAEVADYIESIKGDDMIASYFMPGFYMSNLDPQSQGGNLAIIEPWDANTTHVPLLDTASDSGKFVAGLLSTGLTNPKKVNGLKVQAVSEWVTPSQIAAAFTKASGKQVDFKEVPAEIFQGFLPEAVAAELTQNMVLVRDYSYYGVGTEKEQGKSDEVLGEGMGLTSFDEFLKHKYAKKA